jgi:hypothetical protein
MARIDGAMDMHEMNTVKLFLGDNWKVTVDENGKVLGVENPSQFIANTIAGMAAISNYKHTRQIDSIKISDDGKTAEVTSEENTTGTNAGRPFNGPQHSVDIFNIEGRSIVLASSHSTNLETQPKLVSPMPSQKL